MSQPAQDGPLATEPGPARQPPAQPGRPPARHRPSFAREAAGIFIGALVMSLLIKTFLLQAFFIPSGSMEPTLHGCERCEGDRVLVNKLTSQMGGVRRGDIVVFRDSAGWLANDLSEPDLRGRVQHALALVGLAPSSSQNDLVKRVIGIGGDTVEGRGGKVYVNGATLVEPYVFPGDSPSEDDFRVTVPVDKLWVMGDHRSQSGDSRFHQEDPGKGFVPMTDVVGRAFVIVWPPNRAGTLDRPGSSD